MNDYNKLTECHLAELESIVGRVNLLYGDTEVVVKPSSAQEVSKIVKMAICAKIPITPGRAGSGLSGGAVPACDVILLSVERMNEITEIDRENLIAVLKRRVLSVDEIRAMHKIKLALDPLNILNPGKIFDLTREAKGGS